MSQGKFVISLDFELMWGVRDHHNYQTYGREIEAVHETVPKLIDLFNEFGVKATFSAVGMLFAKDREELEQYLPTKKPSYTKFDLSPYPTYLNSSSIAEHDKLHFAADLIDQLRQSPHEIGTHTFSHYYCLEEGQNKEQFKADLQSAVAIALAKGVELNSIVFPRNQFNKTYLEVCAELGITSVRGTENSWLYKARNREEESQLRRAFRLIDAYVNISGHHCYDKKDAKQSIPMNIAASRFLRPYSPKLYMLEKLKIRRIQKSIVHAAKNGLCYHLWWHPHNFSRNTEQNVDQLRSILGYYQKMNQKYGMASCTMTEISSEWSKRI